MDKTFSNVRLKKSATFVEVGKTCVKSRYINLMVLWRREKLMIFIVLAVIFGLLVGFLINKTIQETGELEKKNILIL